MLLDSLFRYMDSHSLRTRAKRRRGRPAHERSGGSPLFLECLETRVVPGFLAPLAYTAGDSPNAVAVGDFDGDGTDDLAVANYHGATVSVLLGRGDGTFQAAASYAVASAANSVVVGDFDGDGNLDLAVAYSGGVGVLLGRGDGTFGPVTFYPTFYDSLGVAAGDFDGDGNLDLAVALWTPNMVSVLLGRGDGTFQPGVSYPTGPNPFSVAVGDFDGDGHPDLAVANYLGATVSVLLGRGDGTFQPRTDYAAGYAPSSVAVGDFNGDGKPDLAVANAGSMNVSVLLGNGDGTFLPAANYAAGSRPSSVAVADFNGDGTLDLAVANFHPSGYTNVCVLLGNGDGTFQPRTDYTAGDTAESVAVGDFNGDGFPDLSVANWDANTTTILLNDGNWPTSPGPQPRRPLPGPLARDDRALLSLVAATSVFSPAESAQPAPATGVSPMGSVPPELAVSSLDQFFAATPAEQQPLAFWRSQVLARGWRDDWLTAGGLLLDSIGIGTIGNVD